jgi:lipopolysaccharide export system permease protein
MSLAEKYIFHITLAAFLIALGVLTAIIWLTQSLREFDLLTTKGQSLITFFTLTGLAIPSFVMVIAPIALFIAVLYALNKLNSDSELVVLSASGMSTARLMRPFALVSLLVMGLVGATSLYIMPACFLKMANLVSDIRADFLSHILREGQFTNLEASFVFHFRERAPDGAMLGVFIQDRREPDKISTYLAEVGQTVQKDGHNYLGLKKGSVQRIARDSREPAIVVFETYWLDLSQFGAGGNAPLRPRERSTAELIDLTPDESSYVRENMGRFRAELHDRFSNPLLCLAFGMIAFSALAQPRTTRQGRGLAITGAIIALIVLRLGGFGISALVNKSASAVWMVYALPAVAMIACAVYSFAPPLPRLRFFRPAEAA